MINSCCIYFHTCIWLPMVFNDPKESDIPRACKSFQMKVWTMMIKKKSMIPKSSMITEEFQLKVWALFYSDISIFDGLVLKYIFLFNLGSRHENLSIWQIFVWVPTFSKLEYLLQTVQLDASGHTLSEWGKILSGEHS